MLENKTEIRVRYADTDQMQFAYNGKYLEYFEVGRTEMLRANGFPYNKLEKSGFQLPLIEAFLKYKNPAYYDDVLVIHAFVKKYPEFKVHIDYEISRKETGEVVTEGYTTHVFINKETKKAVRPPEFFKNAIKEFYEL